MSADERVALETQEITPSRASATPGRLHGRHSMSADASHHRAAETIPDAVVVSESDLRIVLAALETYNRLDRPLAGWLSHSEAEAVQRVKEAAGVGRAI